MGPKGKPDAKGKNVPPSAPGTDPKEIVTELQKEFFEFQLADIEKKILRIGEREEELTAGTAEFGQKIEEYKKEKGTIVAEKEQLLALKEEEKCKKREDMISLSDEIKTRTEKNKKRVEEMNRKYQEMVAEMTAQIEELEEEVGILEDYKQNKDNYSSELDNMETEMDESEMQHQRNLFYINAKWEKAKVNMKKELQLRLLQLSIEFRATSQKKIGNPCRRVTQENKAIQTMLLQMKEEILEYQDRHCNSKKNMKTLKERSTEVQDQNEKMIARTIIQVYVIKTLQKHRFKLIEKLKEFAAVDALNRSLLRKLNAVSFEVDKKANAIEDIKLDIEEKIEETNVMREATRHLKKSSRRLHVIIRNALKVAEEAMAVRLIPLGGMEEEKYLPMEAKMNLFKKRRDVVFAKKGQILQYLLEFLSKAQLTEDDKRLLKGSTESIGLEGINFSEIYGKPMVSESRDSALKGVEEEDKGPVFYTSLTSLPRSISDRDVAEPEKEEAESYEGEFEEPEEGDEQLVVPQEAQEEDFFEGEEDEEYGESIEGEESAEFTEAIEPAEERADEKEEKKLEDSAAAEN